MEAARNELRAGAITQARKKAMEALDARFGVAADAQSLLRTIDNEEFNLKVHDIQRTFDAAVSAYNRREYQHASELIGQIDSRYLDDGRKARLREFMQTPGMQAQQAAEENANQVKAGPDVLPGIPGTSPADGTGRAHVTDTLPAPSPEKDILNTAASMKNVLFTKLRKEGMDAQQAAAEKVRAGQTSEAVDSLNDYLARLEKVQDLDASQLAQLRKPVEARLQKPGS